MGYYAMERIDATMTADQQRAFYNDNDPFVCQWTRNLMAAGLITKGTVDERSITELKPSDFAGYERCHFFSGIAGWEAALNLAGWQGPAWSASCPCQPLSCAGQRKGHADKRHLWPAFYALVAECNPATIFGEQVASPDGREWFAGIRADLEGLGYAVGGSDLCVASAGAPHIRQRIYWLAVSASEQVGRTGQSRQCSIGRMENPDIRRWKPGNRKTPSSEITSELGLPSEKADGMVFSNGARRNTWKQTGSTVGYGHSSFAASGLGFWEKFDVIECADGFRRIEPGSQPLATGVPARMGRLRAYGNSISPPLAAEFIRAVMDTLNLK